MPNLSSLLPDKINEVIKDLKEKNLSKFNSNYWNVVAQYYHYALDGCKRALVTEFKEALKELCSDEENKEQLEKSGLTKLDLAFITSNHMIIKTLLLENKETDLYQLINDKLKFWSFYQNASGKNYENNMKIAIGAARHNLDHLDRTAFMYTKDGLKENPIFSLTYIQDEVEDLSSLNTAEILYQKIKASFDRVVIYGTGIHSLYNCRIEALLESQNNVMAKLCFIILNLEEDAYKDYGHELPAKVRELYKDSTTPTALIINKFNKIYYEEWLNNNVNTELEVNGSNMNSQDFFNNIVNVLKNDTPSSPTCATQKATFDCVRLIDLCDTKEVNIIGVLTEESFN